MKSLRWVLLILVQIALISAGYAQDDQIKLGDEALQPLQRPALVFPHERHTAVIDDCLRCHHDFDQYGVNTGSEGGKCSECHLKDPSPEDNPVPLVAAFHTMCKSCHQKVVVDRSGRKLPVMCGQCHVRK